jgi:tetratricopeptide (TPR) repeat protein
MYEAVSLFIERATAMVADFSVTNENAPAVAEICARLDGLPLAIELAAARVSILTPQAILERLGNRLKLLGGGAADLPFRQRTLRATIDWSYRLLSPAEQVLFREAAVFYGGCTLEAMEAVCNCSDDEGTDVLEVLSSLVGKSMLSREEGRGGAARYFMFESLQEYGLELLDASGATAEVRKAHAEYFLAYAEAAASLLNGPSQKNQLDALEAEHENFRSGLDWLHVMKDSAPEMRLCAALALYWQVRGYLSEGIRACENSLAADRPAVGRLRGKTFLALGSLQFEKGEYETSAGSLKSALEIFRPLRDKTSIASCYLRLGWNAYKLNDFASAGRFFSAIQAARLSADPSLIASAEKGLGNVAYMCDRFDDSYTLLERSRMFFRSHGDLLELARVLDDLATLSSRRKDYAQAISISHDALALWESVGDESGLLTTYNNLGFLNLQIGNATEARRYYEWLFSAASRAGSLRWQSLACLGIADSCLLVGDNKGASEFTDHAPVAANTEGWEMENGIAYRIRAEILRRTGRFKESIELFNRSRELFRIAKDSEDLEIAENGFVKATDALRGAG